MKFIFERTWISAALILRPSQVLGKCGLTLSKYKKQKFISYVEVT